MEALDECWEAHHVEELSTDHDDWRGREHFEVGGCVFGDVLWGGAHPGEEEDDMGCFALSRW